MLSPVTKIARVEVKAGHVQPLWAGHPWLFQQALTKSDGAEGGDEVIVVDPRGNQLGRGLFDANSAIAVRMFTTDAAQPIDEALFASRIDRALAHRRASGLPCDEPGLETDGYRVVHGEGDGLPGLIVDRYGDTLCVQYGTAGLQRRKESIETALRTVIGPETIVDRTVGASEAPAPLRFRERGLSYELPGSVAQKTGYYFDQRPLRARIETLAKGSRVLDAHCYVGAIAMSAARGGAREVWGVDGSSHAIEAAAGNAERNGLKCRFETTTVAKAFAGAAADGGYDIVICDPPKLSPRRKSRGTALDAYRKLARQACDATAPGGILAFCSCSANVNSEALARALALGARDAGRQATIFERLFQGADHPVPAAFPEGLYLRVLLSRVETPT